MRSLIPVALVALLAVTGCGSGLFRAGPTIAPLISASFLTVRLFTSDAADAQERARLPGLRDALAGALPNAWASATGGRGQLALRNDADIDVELSGTSGTSAFKQHRRGGKVVSRTIVVHTIEDGRRIGIAELITTALHELGHIWCCYGTGTTDGHWSESPPGFSTAGLMSSPMVCQAVRGGEPTCPSQFSERELAEMGLSGR